MPCTRLACTSMNPVTSSLRWLSTFIHIPTPSCPSGSMLHRSSANAASLVVVQRCKLLYALCLIAGLHGRRFSPKLGQVPFPHPLSSLPSHSFILYFLSLPFSSLLAFSASTLLVGRQKAHPPCSLVPTCIWPS